MKKALLILSFAVLLPLFSCTAENDEKPLICETLFINGNPFGFQISALYTVSGEDTMKKEEIIKKSYSAATADGVIDKLIKTEKDAMFKPVKKLVLQKDSEYNLDIAKAYINRSELQLKCDVFEVDENGFYYDEQKPLSFSEYYRKLWEEKQ